MITLHKWLFWVLVPLLLVAGSFWLNRERLHESLVTVRVAIDSAIRDQYAASVNDYFMGKNLPVQLVEPSAPADLSIGTTKQTTVAAVKTATTGQPVALKADQIIKPAATEVFVSTAKDTVGGQPAVNVVKDLAAKLSEGVPKQWTLTALGDVILGRGVYWRMASLGYTSPFSKMADVVNDTDLTLANLECTIADGLDYPILGMSFTAPTAAIAGLKLAGIDGVNLANNHSLNGGEEAYLDMLASLKKNQIAYFGGGANAVEAYAAQTFEVKGTKIGVLGYSSIAGTIAAGSRTPGHAYFGLPPWGDMNEAEIKRMAADVKAAKAQSDLVMVYVHWGAEYTHTASAEMRAVAHRLVDAGADVILGTHPHWVEGIEWYKDRLITYSLGNFVFDQEWSIETKQGVVLKATFERNRIVSAKFVPYQIENYHQPRLVSDAVGQKILSDVYDHSWWPIN